MVHVTYNNSSHDLDFEQVFPEHRHEAIGIQSGAEVSPHTVSETHIRNAVAQHFDVSNSEFADHFVEINPNGNITVRPKATFGRG